MFQSIRPPHLILRIGLAVVFLWFGVDKFIQPQYWINAWVPQTVIDVVGKSGLSAQDFIHLIGILEVLIALSLITGFFARYFSAAGACFLVVVVLSSGFNEVLIRDIGLNGALIALAVWPERSYV